MAIQMTATDLKARLLAVLDDVRDGEEVEITEHGRTVARLVPAAAPTVSTGALAGIASSADDAELYSTGLW
jgi:prevent-host-death family protein